MMSYCCEKCFNDVVLRNKIVEQGNKGKCNYCNSNDVYVADTTLFTDSFDYLLQYYKEPEVWLDYNPMKYEKYDIASPLIDLINDEWDIFSKEIKENKNDEKLLFDIVDTYGNEQYRGLSKDDLFISIDSPAYLEKWEESWTDFKENLKYNNRFFPQSHDLVFNKYFDDVLNNRKMYLAENLIVYRSRMGIQKNDQMLAPPKDKATAGRANPHGISYLYCARDKETCIAEVRPWKDAIITIANLKLKRELRLVDLRKRSISPFLFKSPYDFLEVVFLLSNFSDDLSTPVSPHHSNVEYLPTQYITELIKSKDYDGIVYSSAMASGDNIVLFDDNNVEVEWIELVKISGINYEHKEHWIRREESEFQI